MNIKELLNLTALSPTKEVITALDEPARNTLAFDQIARLGALLEYPLHRITMTPLRTARLDLFYESLNCTLALGASSAVLQRLQVAFEVATTCFIKLRGGDENAARQQLDQLHNAQAVTAFETIAPGVLQQCIDAIEKAAGYTWTVAAIAALATYNDSLAGTSSETPEPKA